MPIHKVPGGYKWGSHGHVYPSHAGAERQAAAAYAHGYTGKDADTPAVSHYRALVARLSKQTGWTPQSHRRWWQSIQNAVQAPSALAKGPHEHCVQQVQGHVHDPHAFCAWAEHEATGSWPAERAHHETAKAVNVLDPPQRVPSYFLEDSTNGLAKAFGYFLDQSLRIAKAGERDPGIKQRDRERRKRRGTSEQHTGGKNPHAVILGRRGGHEGGPARAHVLSPTRRREIARQGGKARWNQQT